tara:strand:- start:1177 stop:1389 length:213 start_codon:yes stop_codon:yes gene_type:complete
MNETPKPDTIEWWREKCRNEERQKSFWMNQALSSHAKSSRGFNQDLIFCAFLLSFAGFAICSALICLGAL